MPRKDHGPLSLDDLEGRTFATVSEYAAIMRLDPRTVVSAIKAGDIPAIRNGQQYRIPTAWIKAAASAGSAAS